MFETTTPPALFTHLEDVFELTTTTTFNEKACVTHWKRALLICCTRDEVLQSRQMSFPAAPPPSAGWKHAACHWHCSEPKHDMT